MFNRIYPVIDISAGGSVDGMIAASARLLAMADADTRIIPGHGPLADRPAVERFRAMLVGTRDAVQALVTAGKSLDETIAAKPTAPWDDPWGTGFMKPEVYVKTVYLSLTRKP
jgi:glyoxylase-like metal-dependent hydrolase (beta-lactamase superfamily II)